MAIVYVEGYDWTAGNPQFTNDLGIRYNVGGSPNNMSQYLPGGRFGGNAATIGGGQFTSFQLKNGPFGPRIVWGFACKIEGIQGAQVPLVELWDGLNGSGGTAQCTLGMDSTGHLVALAGNNGAPLGLAGPTVPAFNAWFYIEIDVLIGSGGTGSFRCDLDGVTQFNLAGVTTQQSGIAQCSWIMHLGNWGGHSTQYDDEYVKTTAGPLGPSRIVLKKPSSDGALTQWTASPVGPHFSNVNEVPADGDTTFNFDATAGDIDLYGFTALGQTPAHIWAVQVDLYARKDDAAARAIATEVRSGGANFVGASQTLSSTYLASILQIYEQDPNTAAAWTLANLDAAQFGVQTIS